jgi:calcineurin-like phosphoesterase family protein
VATLWFTSDTHFGHANILTFKDAHGQLIRPGFTDVWEMNEILIEKWNTVVRPQDHVYHLGDVSMMRPTRIAALLRRLHGHLRLVRGNHDVYKTKEYLEFFDEIYGIRVIDKMIFTHIPIHPTNMGRFKANVHGHIHQHPSPPPVVTLKQGQVKTTQPYINISVEQTDYTPVSLEWIKARVHEQS